MKLSAVELAKDHVFFHHYGADGWITVAKREGSIFKQYHYRPEELAEQLTGWLGEDVYFSQNTFYKPHRAIENIRQLRALYVDVDFYIFNYDYRWTLGNIELLVNDRELPSPNLVINSGRGVVCVWLIEPVPSKALPLWQAVQKDFYSKLEKFGGDSKASDAARVFRIAGSINSKNGEKVSVMYRHENRYSLRELQYEYLPEIKPKTAPKRKGRPSKIVNLYNTYTLHHARLLDLVKLVELRNYDIRGYRETILFLYRYWKCCFLNDADRALMEALAFNQELTEPLSEREVIRATKSAETAWEAKNNATADRIAREKGYPGAGYNISNTKLIQWLDITAEEMQLLSTIIDGNEKRRRKRLANEKMRREVGIKTRAEYLATEQEKTEDRLWLLRKALEQNPNESNVQLGKLLNVSEAYIRKLKRKL
ncbi:replication protein [Sporosarcina sp. FSL W7-1283]|uniref:replication protein n=1 Tax=Sporosarcina sp. FSL W7-1283 TaxID=2921560 RepID=UPI0030FA834C